MKCCSNLTKGSQFWIQLDGWGKIDLFWNAKRKCGFRLAKPVLQQQEQMASARRPNFVSAGTRAVLKIMSTSWASPNGCSSQQTKGVRLGYQSSGPESRLARMGWMARYAKSSYLMFSVSVNFFYGRVIFLLSWGLLGLLCSWSDQRKIRVILSGTEPHLFSLWFSDREWKYFIWHQYRTGLTKAP